VLLPLREKTEARPAARKAAPERPFKGGGTVLLVEDQAPVREVTRAMLERLGFSVVAAENGAAAVKHVSDHGEAIRCVICDLSMPGMNGWETLRALRAMRPDLPAVLASGYDEAQVVSPDPGERVQAFLFKPYQKADLREALGRALEGAGGGST
jgi:CheY-like chemotaxis protein